MSDPKRTPPTPTPYPVRFGAPTSMSPEDMARPKRRLNLDPNLADGQHWTIHDEPDATLMEIIQLWMDEADVGASVTIKLVEMTDAEVEALPDI